MTRATVVNIKVSTLASVYVGHGSDAFGRRLSGARWHNPALELDPAKAARKYFRHLHNSPELVERARTELAGQQLACTCPQPGPCHGLILAALANGRELDEIEYEWREAGLLAEQQELFA